MTNWRIEVGDCRDVLGTMLAGSVHTVVTSPPYFGLRDYGTGEWNGGDPTCDHVERRSPRDERPRNGRTGGMATVGAQDSGALARQECRCGARRVDHQLGLEPTPDEFVAALVDVFRGVRRVLRDDGTVWLNLGDSYAGGGGFSPDSPSNLNGSKQTTQGGSIKGTIRPHGDVKSKDLLGIPWLVAFALRADGWYLRSDIVWSKPNPMPESVTDRPTKAHEYVFLLSKRASYFYDADAIREGSDHPHLAGKMQKVAYHDESAMRQDGDRIVERTAHRNKRSVWTVATQPYAGAHFATFPPKLIEPCILAGAPERACGECGAPWVRVVERGPQPPEPAHRDPAKRLEPGQAGNVGAGNMGFRASRLSGQEMAAWREAHPDRTVGFEPSCSHGDGSASGVVLDPFAGSGTTGMVAIQHGREFVGIELSPTYAQMARDRISTWERCGFRNPANGAAPPEGQESLFSL